MLLRIIGLSAALQCLLLFGSAFDTPSKPSSSGYIAVDPSGARVYVVNPDSNSISVIDTRSNRLFRDVRVGQDPRSLAFGAQDEIKHSGIAQEERNQPGMRRKNEISGGCPERFPSANRRPVARFLSSAACARRYCAPDFRVR